MHLKPDPLWYMADLGLDVEAAEAMAEEISESIDKLASMSFAQLLQSLWTSLKEVLPALGLSLLFFMVGYVLIRIFLRFTKGVLGRSRADPTLHNFILSTIRIVLYVILAITCVGILGVNFAPMIAALGAIGLALSLAMQDILSNIAGGISLLFSRPFAKEDYVEVSGQPGTVLEIGMVYTVLRTIDGKIIHLPNGDVTKSTIVNYTAEPVRRTDITLNIKESSDFEAVKAAIRAHLERNPRVLGNPAPILRFTDHTYQYVKLTVMVWGLTDELYDLRGELIGSLRKLVYENGY